MYVNTLNKYTNKKKFRKQPLILCFHTLLLVGIMVFSGFYVSAPSVVSALEKDSKSYAPATRPESFANLADQLGPTVVNIKATKIEKVRGFQRHNIPEGPFDDFFRRFHRQMPQGPETRPMQASSAVILLLPITVRM